MFNQNQNQSTTAPTEIIAPIAKQLTAQHYKECTEKRGLSPQWVIANCSSVLACYATQYLGYKALADGLWLKGCNHQIQYKPDKPWKSEGDKKAAKYRSPFGEYDAMLPQLPDVEGVTDLTALPQEEARAVALECAIQLAGRGGLQKVTIEHVAEYFGVSGVFVASLLDNDFVLFTCGEKAC